MIFTRLVVKQAESVGGWWGCAMSRLTDTISPHFRRLAAVLRKIGMRRPD